MEVAEQKQGSEQQQQQQEQVQQQGRSYTQEELDRITAKVRRNATREAEARIYREVANRGQGQERREPEKPKEVELKEPVWEEFEAQGKTWKEYVDARADFASAKASRAERERAAKEEGERKATEKRTERDKAFKKHADAVMQEIPDFAQVIESAQDVMISEAMGEAIKDAGALGPRILYFLVKNPQEAERIAEMDSTTAQTRAIGKIEARIEAELEAKKNKDKDESQQEGDDGQQKEQRSEQRGEQEERERGNDGRFKAQEKESRKAPDPIDPGSGRSVNQDRGPTDKDSDKDWFAKRLAQEKAERERQRRK